MLRKLGLKLAGAAVIALLMISGAQAQSNDFLKGKNVELIITLAPGGPADVVARILADAMSKDLGVNISVVPTPGAGGQIAIQQLVSSEPDGQTMAMAATWSAVATYLKETTSYSRKDFRLVARAFIDPTLFVVPKDSPFQTVGDIMKAAKEKPGSVKMGVTSVTSSNAIMLMMMEREHDARFTFVPFGGGAPAATALARGDIDAAVLSTAPVKPFVESSDIRVLAMVDDWEQKVFPGAPSAKSQGYDLESLANFGFLLPANTPQEVVDGWSAAIKRALEQPEVVQKMEEVNLIPSYMGSEEYEEYWTGVETELADIMKFAEMR